MSLSQAELEELWNRRRIRKNLLMHIKDQIPLKSGGAAISELTIGGKYNFKIEYKSGFAYIDINEDDFVVVEHTDGWKPGKVTRYPMSDPDSLDKVYSHVGNLK